MKQIIVTSLLLFLTIVLFGQQKETALVYFNYGRHELTQQSRATLDSLLAKVKSKDLIQIEVNGHSDNDGGGNFNAKLSHNRAAAVQQYLISKGVSVDNFMVKSYGEEQPVAPNKGEAEKQKNRRVEIIITYKNNVEVDEPSKTELKEPTGLQTFKVSPESEIVINGHKGTVIRIPKNTFVDAQGLIVKGEITIELLEIYDKSDMILYNIQTTSNKKLLETSGMIYIRAFLNNKELSLRKNGFYTIAFLTKNKKRNMNVFYGDTTSQNINWQQADRNFQNDISYGENQKELSKYIFDATKLGWINCDRFMDFKDITDIIVNTTDTLGVNFCLVLNKFNSVMNVSDRRGVIKFNNIPVGQIATLVAFKKTDMEILYASKKFVVQNKQSVPIALEKLTYQEFQNRIKQFD